MPSSGNGDSQPSKIYIGNIPDNFPEDELRDMFKPFGDITSCHMKESFAFIEYAAEADAQEAMNAMNKKDLDGRMIRVEKTRSAGAYGSGQDNSGRLETSNIFVANIPNGTKEDELIKVFEAYGEVSRIRILPPYPGVNALSGFVDFHELDHAIKAHDDTIVMAGQTLRTDYNSKRPPRKDTSRDFGSRREDRGYGNRYDDSRRNNRQHSPPRHDRNRSRSRSRGGGRDDRHRRERSRSPQHRSRHSPRSPPRRGRDRSRSPPSRSDRRRSTSRSPPRRR